MSNHLPQSIALIRSALCVVVSCLMSIAVPAVAASEIAADPIPDSFIELLNETNEGVAVLDDHDQKIFTEMPDELRKLFFAAADQLMITSGRQLKLLLSITTSNEKKAMILKDNCILCHINPDMQENATLFTLNDDRGPAYEHLNLRSFLADRHFRSGLSCSGCHGGSPADTDMSDEIYQRWPKKEVRNIDRSWIPQFCSRCHSDPQFMRNYNPALPIDQYIKYADSMHGRVLLDRHDSKAAECTSCHGIHNIFSAQSPASKVFPRNLPETCGRCHSDARYMKGYTIGQGLPMPTNQVAMYLQGTHGKALMEKNDLGVAVCNDCHGDHAAMPPGISKITQVCGNCHLEIGELYAESPLAQIFQHHSWPDCYACHGAHRTIKLAFSDLKPQAGTLCNDCHQQHGSDKSIAAATLIYNKIDGIFTQRDQLHRELEALRREVHYLDMDDLNARMDLLDDQLKELGKLLHSFSVKRLEQIVGQATMTADQIGRKCKDIRSEHQRRYYWLTLLTTTITVVAILLFFKIRQLDKRFPLLAVNPDQSHDDDPLTGEK